MCTIWQQGCLKNLRSSLHLVLMGNSPTNWLPHRYGHNTSLLSTAILPYFRILGGFLKLSVLSGASAPISFTSIVQKQLRSVHLPLASCSYPESSSRSTAGLSKKIATRY